MNKSFFYISFLALFACEIEPQITKVEYEPLFLSEKDANQLVDLPLSCVYTEYPYKLGQVLSSEEDLKEPIELHPAFYGCFDWHSAVHGHWSLIKLIKEFPEMERREEIINALTQNLTEEKIQLEVEYFHQKYNKSFERTYGWAWLLKLVEELHTWDDPLARELEKNLKPLSDLIVERYIEFLPKLVYPIRVGEHTNTAFGLSFAWDFANTLNEQELKVLIEQRARDFYFKDAGCPLNWEPSGYDFLSPCLEEIDIMRRVLNKEEFSIWITDFMPHLDSNFNLDPGNVSDRTDGKLVHLDGLNFSRAWVFYGLAKQYPEYNYLVKNANEHLSYSLPNLVSDSYEGGHWLGSFAIFALGENSR